MRYNLPLAPSELPASEAELATAIREENDNGNENDASAETQASEMEDQPRSLRPGQKGFAERLMSKYGWTKGSGLGATGSGIVNPLRVQINKQKKPKKGADGEMGGTSGGGVGASGGAIGGRGKIIGGNTKPRKKATGEDDDVKDDDEGKESLER